MRRYLDAFEALAPTPAVMVSCSRAGERPDIVTVAWAGTVCSRPPMLSISLRKTRLSHSIISDTREFVLNIVGRDLARAMDLCGIKSGRDIDKFAELGLTPLPSQRVASPGIAESPLCAECAVRQVIELGSHDMFIAEILGVSAMEEAIAERGTDLARFAPVSFIDRAYFEPGAKIGTFGYSAR